MDGGLMSSNLILTGHIDDQSFVIGLAPSETHAKSLAMKWLNSNEDPSNWSYYEFMVHTISEDDLTKGLKTGSREIYLED